jgi:Leucine-rich repeat (LRR) protein
MYENLMELTCCKNRVVEIGTYKRLKKIYISKCKSLIRLCDQPRLDDLRIDWCKISELEGLKKLRKLHISNCGIRIIPDLPELRELHCSNCDSLREISRLDKLVKLSCDNNKRLVKINTFDNLMNLTLKFSPIVKVPYMPKLQELVCCNLDNLKYISSFDELEFLGIRNCKNLMSEDIGYMPRIKSYNIFIHDPVYISSDYVLVNTHYEILRVLRRLLRYHLKSFTDIFIKFVKKMLMQTDNTN